MDAYIYQAALLCEGCGLDTRRLLRSDLKPNTGDSDDFPQGPYGDGGGEADCPQHCGMCNEFLENPLTSNGYAGLRAEIEFSVTPPNLPGPALKMWADFYLQEVEDEN